MTTTAGLRRPPGRYDERRPLPRAVVVGGALVLVLLLVVFSFLAYQHYAERRTPFSTVTYRVDSDHAVTIRFQVARDAGRTVQCLLQARDRDGSDVGSLVATVGPGSGTETRSAVVPTTRRAVVGEVLSCRPAP